MVKFFLSMSLETKDLSNSRSRTKELEALLLPHTYLWRSQVPDDIRTQNGHIAELKIRISTL